MTQATPRTQNRDDPPRIGEDEAMTRFGRFVGLVTLVSLAAGAPAPGSAADRPPWVDRPPSPTVDTLYFTGFALAADTEEAARNLATRHALAEVVGYFGQTVSSRIASEQVETGRDYRQEVRISVLVEGREVALKGVRVAQVFVEKGDAGVSAWALVAYPRAEYDAAQASLKRNDTDRAQAALAAFSEGRSLLAAGRVARAIERMEQARTTLEGLPTTLLDAGDIRSTDLLAGETTAALRQARQIQERVARTVAAKVVHVVDGQPVALEGAPAQLDGEVPALVAAHGLTAARPGVDDARLLAAAGGDAAAAEEAGARSGAAWLLVLRIESRHSSELYGQFFAEAAGTTVLIESATGRVVSGDDLGRAKGGHVTRRDASLKAAAGLRDAARRAMDAALDQARPTTAGR